MQISRITDNQRVPTQVKLGNRPPIQSLPSHRQMPGDSLQITARKGMPASAISFDTPSLKSSQRQEKKRQTNLSVTLQGQLITGDGTQQLDRPATGIASIDLKAEIPYKEDFTIHVAASVGAMDAETGQKIHEKLHRSIGSVASMDAHYNNSVDGVFAQGGLGLQWDFSGNDKSLYPFVQVDSEFGVMDNRLKLSTGIKGELPWFMKGDYSFSLGASTQFESQLNDNPEPFGFFVEAKVKGAAGQSLLGTVPSKYLLMGSVDVLPEGKVTWQTPQYAVGDTNQVLFDVTLLRYNLSENSNIVLGMGNDVLGETDHGKTGSFFLGFNTKF